MVNGQPASASEVTAERSATRRPGRVTGEKAQPLTRTRELLTVNEVAEQLGTSTRFVRRLVSERRIAFVYLGRSVRIAQKDVDEFVDRGRVAPIRAVIPRSKWA